MSHVYSCSAEVFVVESLMKIMTACRDVTWNTPVILISTAGQPRCLPWRLWWRTGFKVLHEVTFCFGLYSWPTKVFAVESLMKIMMACEDGEGQYDLVRAKEIKQNPDHKGQHWQYLISSCIYCRVLLRRRGQGHEKYFLLTEFVLQRTRVQGKHTAKILKLVSDSFYLKGSLKQIPL